LPIPDKIWVYPQWPASQSKGLEKLLGISKSYLRLHIIERKRKIIRNLNEENAPPPFFWAR